MAKLNMMKPKAGGGFTEKFRLTEKKHLLRIYPFMHDGEQHLAALNFIHFTAQGEAPIQCLGTGCPVCLEAQKTGNKRLKKVTRYPMLVVNVEAEGEDKKVVLFDAPASIYKQMYSILEGVDTDDYLGDEGMDFMIKTNAGSQPSDRYNVMIRVKGSESLEFGEPKIDVVEEVEADREPVATDDDDEPADEFTCKACEDTGVNSKSEPCPICSGKADEEEDEEEEKPAKKKAEPKEEKDEDPWADEEDENEGEEDDKGADEEDIQDVQDGDEEDDGKEDEDDISKGDKVVFKNKGKNLKGKFTGKFRKGKMVIEANGQLWTVDSEKVTKA